MTARVPAGSRIFFLDRCAGAARAVVLVLVLLALALPGGPALASDGHGPGGEAPAAEFRIGVGDRLGVFVYGGEIFPEGKEVCLVRPDGRISLPLVGEVLAAGRTPAELAAAIARKVEAYQENPEVTVSIEEIHSYRVFVLGEVQHQMMIESVAPLTLLQALAMAGGFTEFARGDIVVLRNTEPGKKERIEVDVEKILKGKAPAEDIPLRAGDVVVALR